MRRRVVVTGMAGLSPIGADWNAVSDALRCGRSAIDHARARGARIHAEVVGYGTNCDGRHITNPDREGMAAVMRLALDDASVSAAQIGYVGAHGTATEAGDIAESLAMQDVFGERIPTSSLKSYIGHTLGACGALESWMMIEMQREGWFAPTLNLDHPDPRCGRLDYLVGSPRQIESEYVMKNNFALGGVNTSLVFRRTEPAAGSIGA